jgi:serine/threonine-protein kinase SRPK3
MSQHIAKIQSKHEGRRYVRLIQDSITIPGPFGEHFAMVFEPLRQPLWLLGRHLGTVGLPPTILKAFQKVVLQGLDFLHSECHIVHTGKLLQDTLNESPADGVIRRPQS